MNSHERSDRLFDQAKKQGLENPMNGDGAPTRQMVSEAIGERESFLAGLDRAIEFHRTNQNDPYGIGNAVMVALKEVKKAYSDAFRPF
jgi:hypothetical protein